MKLATTHHYPSPPDRVRAMLTDPAFWAGVQARGVIAVAAAPTATGVKVALTLTSPAELRRLAGDVLHATFDIGWQPSGDGWAGPVNMSVAGLPATFTGTSQIKPDGPGTVVTYEGNLKVAVPLLGPGLERQAGPIVLGVVDAQQGAGLKW